MDGVAGTDGTYASNGSRGAAERPPGSRPQVRVAITELRDDLAEWLNRVAWGGETLLVHRRGRPLALVVPVGAGGVAEDDPRGRGVSPLPPPLAEGGDGEPAAAAGQEGPPEDRERDREDLRAIFRAIAASAGEEARDWRPVRPDGPRVRLLAAAARELRALGGERRAAAERLLDLLAAGSLEDVPPLSGTGGRVYRFTPDTGGGGLLWRREEDGSLTVLVVRPPESDET